MHNGTTEVEETEAQEEQQVETRNIRSLVSNWDEYVGQYVCIQLKKPYFVITSPGRACQQQLEDGSKIHINVLVVAGILGVKKDDYGNVRVTLLMVDPDPERKTKVRADFDSDLIDAISVTELEQQSRIITPN